MPTCVSLSPMRCVSNLPNVPSATALIAMATESGRVRDFALFVATLPCHRDTRKSGNFVDSRILLPKRNDKWLPRFQSNLWAHHIRRLKSHLPRFAE